MTCEQWPEWLEKTTMEVGAFFEFGAIEVVHCDDVSTEDDIFPSLIINTLERNGLEKVRMCLDGSAVLRNDAKRSAGLPDDDDDALTAASADTPSYASPCADSTCVLLFASLCVS